MIVPSIDVMGGTTVQLVGGREKKLDAGLPGPIARTFSVAGEIAVIDLDAAIGGGHNRELIEPLVREHACRVGGGIRSYEAAAEWLDSGAAKVIIGTAATPELLRRLPRERVVAALDCEHGEIVVKGWRERTGLRVADRLAELRHWVGGFLVTFVEREGRMLGIEMDRVREVVAAAGDARVTVAGGVATAAEIGEIDRAGADAQVGMAIYTGAFELGDAIAATLRSDRPDGLWPTVVCDERGAALGLVYSSVESLREAVRTRTGVYHSRRTGLWRKGDTSGDTQELIRVDTDCDRDALRFVVRQRGRGFCHAGTRTCFGPAEGLAALEFTLAARREEAPLGSYSRRLFDDPTLLASKIAEEGRELAAEIAAAGTDRRVIEEAADVVYFTAAALAARGLSLSDVEQELERRSRRITRRAGDAKPEVTA